MQEENNAKGLSGSKSKKEINHNSLEERQRRARSVERNSIKLAFSGMNELEYEYFEELLK